jgi:hypothetical protein
MPFVQALSELCKSRAGQHGFLALYDGARRHFNQWQARGLPWTKGAGPCAIEQAQARVGDPSHSWYRHGLQRVKLHTALNALIQGTAARHTKLWMRAVWREGVVPLLQMHDCLDCSVSSREQAELVARLGCEAVKLKVPMRVDTKFGRSWADASHAWEELHPGPGPKAETGIPFMITAAMKVKLRGLGHSDADISDMKPGAAVEILRAAGLLDGAAAAPPSPSATERAGSGDTAARPQLTSAPPQPASSPEPSTATPSTINGAHVEIVDIVTARPAGSTQGKICCPFHDDHTPSCQLYDDGHYHCFVCGAHGSIEDDLDIDAETVAKVTAGGSDDRRTLGWALKLWDDGKPIAGTLAERYLVETRKLDPAMLGGDIDAVLRFHPHCPFGPQQRHPCLVALYRDTELGTPAGIIRIGLTPEGGKIARYTLGRWPGSRAIKLRAIANGDAALAIGEGIETVLGAIRCGAITSAAWAMGPKNGIAGFPILPGIKYLGILVDNDASAPAGARACATRWVAAGRTVVLLTPNEVKDFNDVVMP